MHGRAIQRCGFHAEALDLRPIVGAPARVQRIAPEVPELQAFGWAVLGSNQRPWD